MANEGAGTSRVSINGASEAPSLSSNAHRGSSQRLKNSNPTQENYSTYKLDENCSVVDKSMKWEGFNQFHKQRAPFVAERTLSRDSTSSRGQNRSQRRFQSTEMRLPPPPRTPSYTSSQEFGNFTEDNLKK